MKKGRKMETNKISYAPVAMKGFKDDLKTMLPLVLELKEKIFNLGYGVSDMSYMGWTTDGPETQNMIKLYKDLQNTSGHLYKIIKQGLGKNE